MPKLRLTCGCCFCAGTEEVRISTAKKDARQAEVNSGQTEGYHSDIVPSASPSSSALRSSRKRFEATREQNTVSKKPRNEVVVPNAMAGLFQHLARPFVIPLYACMQSAQ